jgi:hypothetical protein
MYLQKLKLLAGNLHLTRLAFKFNVVEEIWKCCLLAHYVAWNLNRLTMLWYPVQKQEHQDTT